MGFFSDYFGLGGTGYSTTPRPLSTETLHHLFWATDRPNLTRHLKEIVGEAVLKRRTSDGKISLNKINGILRELEHHHTLTELDRHDFFAIFKNHFETHSNH